MAQTPALKKQTRTTDKDRHDVWGVLLLRRHLSHVDAHADDLAGLHSHGAGALAVCAADTDARGRVEGRGRGVFGAGTPRPRLPVVHGAGVLVTVPHLLEGGAVGTQGSTWQKNIE